MFRLHRDYTLRIKTKNSLRRLTAVETRSSSVKISLRSFSPFPSRLLCSNFAQTIPPATQASINIRNCCVSVAFLVMGSDKLMCSQGVRKALWDRFGTTYRNDL